MDREQANGEIGLAEVFFRLWAYKFLFLAMIFISVSCSVFYITNTPKLYTSSSIFVPEKQNSSNNLASGLLSRTTLPIIPGFSSNLDALIERFLAREFVLELADELKLYDDPFFNSYDPKIQEPFWKAKLKSLIKWKSRSSNPAKIAESNVLQSFKNNITITETDGGAMEIRVDHFNPERAAEIANHIMTKIISLLKKEKLQSTNDRLDYLSQRLADSLINFENAEEKLKQFTLSNNPAALASFYKGSIMLDNLRTQQEDSKKQIETINVLLSKARHSSPTFQDYAALRNRYPLLDQSNFRRILGISEIISAWSWPSVETLARVQNSLRDRAGSLDTEIRKYESEATKYAISAEEQTKLTRELKIAESIYLVLFEQVKTQSLIAGFAPDGSQVIAAADAAITETKPKKFLILNLAATFGFFISALLALILSRNKGVFYSSGELLKAINPKFHHKIRRLRYYRTSSLQELQSRLIQRPIPWLKQLFLETSTNRGISPIIVADTTNFDNADLIARLLTVYAHEFDRSVAYLDLSKKPQFQDREQGTLASDTITDIKPAKIYDGCTEYNYQSGKQNVDWLFSKSFQETLDFLNTKYHTIIFSANSDVLDLLQASGKLHESKLVIHASKGKTTFDKIHKLNEQGNIEVALLS